MAKCTLSRVHVLFISAAVAEGRVFTSGLFIVVVLWGNTQYSLYNSMKNSLQRNIYVESHFCTCASEI